MFQEKRVTAVLLAGGSGSRFGGAKNKVYVEANGLPILEYSRRALEASPLVDELVIVVRKEDEKEIQKFLIRTKKPVQMVLGGATRQESVYHALKAAGGEIVLIQDGARPMLTERYIRDCIEQMAFYPGATIAVRSKDTIKLSNTEGIVVSTTRRADTWIVQTPQCFQKEVLLSAHEKERGNLEITDDCMLLELAGLPVKLVEGEYSNIKVTTGEDLALAERFLELQAGEGEEQDHGKK
ncbi:2-C-methyl-D-erythritol 4-phosphate cytidylyltransferase [Hominifimenecus sp. rT4P-3]|uniref:2-C-methyl-D-erythritol 4-phosphate cytidylyltransferase n=1 Tax=Hominifimenecus sp. rT4P-3 TaxID=3242979 RepID=UPI003DA33D25